MPKICLLNCITWYLWSSNWLVVTDHQLCHNQLDRRHLTMSTTWYRRKHSAFELKQLALFEQNNISTSAEGSRWGGRPHMNTTGIYMQASEPHSQWHTSQHQRGNSQAALHCSIQLSEDFCWQYSVVLPPAKKRWVKASELAADYAEWIPGTDQQEQSLEELLGHEVMSFPAMDPFRDFVDNKRKFKASVSTSLMILWSVLSESHRTILWKHGFGFGTHS